VRQQSKTVDNKRHPAIKIRGQSGFLGASQEKGLVDQALAVRPGRKMCSDPEFREGARRAEATQCRDKDNSFGQLVSFWHKIAGLVLQE
jgi:hypothetical protein